MEDRNNLDVIVIGAGVIGPAIATSLARQGRKVMIVERDWKKPDRIVGELLQPGGIRALKNLGMIKAVNNIHANYCSGYYIKYHDKELVMEYPEKSEIQKYNRYDPVQDCVYDENDKLSSDETINAEEWEEDERVRGVSFHHGDFLGNLRQIAKDEKNVTPIEGTVTELLRNKVNNDEIVGVRVKESDGVKEYFSKLVICCDGIYSKFRKQLSEDNVPNVGSYFVGLSLKNPVYPAKNHGHVILGDHAPVLFYQIGPDEARVLCAYRSTKPPSQSNNALFDYLNTEVLPALPKSIQPSFKEALNSKRFRSMPNQYLIAKRQGNSLKGIIFLGDSLNMRHPLTGGGMTVGLSDAVVLARLLHPDQIKDFNNYALLAKKLNEFHSQRKKVDVVINTLSMALYALFAADSNALKILQMGCFNYFLLGGECVTGPMGLLAGVIPAPFILFKHFFKVAFYGIYCNFKRRGVVGFPLALIEAIHAFIVAVLVLGPYLFKEILS